MGSSGKMAKTDPGADKKDVMSSVQSAEVLKPTVHSMHLAMDSTPVLAKREVTKGKKGGGEHTMEWGERKVCWGVHTGGDKNSSGHKKQVGEHKKPKWWMPVTINWKPR
jgi:hypothetical protein